MEYFAQFGQPKTRQTLTYWKESRGPLEGRWHTADGIEGGLGESGLLTLEDRG